MTSEERNKIWFDSLLRIAVSEGLKNEMDLLPSKEELDKRYHPSDKLNRRIKNIIIRKRIKGQVEAHGKIVYKIATILIILFAASSITLLSVEATRNAIFNVIIQQLDKYTEIKFEKDGANESNGSLYSPTYLPQGFVETSNVTYGSTIMITYTNNEGIEILFKQGSVGTSTTLIDNENTKYKEIKINERDGYLFEALTSEDYNVLLWQVDGISFELQSLINSDELVQIGNSVK